MRRFIALMILMFSAIDGSNIQWGIRFHHPGSIWAASLSLVFFVAVIMFTPVFKGNKQ
jgi:hypothetical protein